MKSTFLHVFFIVVSFLLSAVSYSSLSPEIAIHWTNGEITNTAPKIVGVLLIPVIMIIVYWLLAVLFKVDPKKENVSGKIKNISISTVLVFLFSVHVAVLAIGLGYNLSNDMVAGLIIGMIMVILGNVMPQAKQNFIFGLRTPWTLSNEKVWTISNRFTGRIFFAAGFIIILSAFIIPQYNLVFTVSLVVLVALIGTVHSFLVYKRVVTLNK